MIGRQIYLQTCVGLEQGIIDGVAIERDRFAPNRSEYPDDYRVYIHTTISTAGSTPRGSILQHSHSLYQTEEHGWWRVGVGQSDWGFRHPIVETGIPYPLFPGIRYRNSNGEFPDRRSPDLISDGCYIMLARNLGMIQAGVFQFGARGQETISDSTARDSLALQIPDLIRSLYSNVVREGVRNRERLERERPGVFDGLTTGSKRMAEDEEYIPNTNRKNFFMKY